ncbi:Tm-1-like ATP-binding domain-containing protein [soil metagenome]
MATVVLLGTLDTKGAEYAYLREQIERNSSCDVIVIDGGIMAEPQMAVDISRQDVAKAAETTIDSLIAGNDRGAAVAAMADGASKIVSDLFAAGRLQGILGLGGTGGTSLVTHAMQALPVGVPKLMVSTVASGDTRPYVGAVDITMMYSVVDIAGINRISARILGNAAAGIAGMATAYAAPLPDMGDKPLIGATMFGVTTPSVTKARELLEARGYEVLVFHATGAGGQSMEALVSGGFLDGVLDITTTEMADELVGGVFSAGPDRMKATCQSGLPQVVSLGALDMVNFGPKDTVPERFRDRNLDVHNPSITLMRTTPEECAELGRRIGTRLSAAAGPVSLFIPRGGVSAIAVEGGVFHDADADTALFDGLLKNLGDNVEIHDLEYDINDPRFATAMADRLVELISTTTQTGKQA